MSKLLEQIKADRLTAMKQGDKIAATHLTTLLGEASPSGTQQVTDQDVEKVVQKFVKNAREMLEYAQNDATKKYNIEWEIVLYESYLPKQLTEQELRFKISELISQGCDNIGKVMGKLNQQHKGQFDGKLASKIIKEIM